MSANLTPQEKDRIFDTLDVQTKILEKLERGMYGDRQNKVAGVLDDVSDIKAWIAKSKIKISFIAGIGTAIGFGMAKGWEWAVNHFK